MIRFSVPGEPVAWQRVVPRGGMSYMPKETRLHEANVRDWATLAVRGYQFAIHGQGYCPEIYPLSGSFWIGAAFYLGMYGYQTKRMKRPTIRNHDADLDNLLKLVKDALRGVIYVDDKQVRGYTPGTKKVLGCPQPHTVIYAVPESEIDPSTLQLWASLPGGE